MKVEEYIQSLSQLPLSDINSQLEEVCGISDFFSDTKDVCSTLRETRTDGYEYGDWQTNQDLSNKVIQLVNTNFQPQVLIEPTCGKGNFVLAALDSFETLTDVYAIEIFKPYLQQLKYDILQGYLDGKYKRKINFHLMHYNVFDVDWEAIKREVNGKKLLIVGNPPWVTNSDLGRIDSNNLPQKANIKQVKGLSAITGKGNFDIAEYICYQLIQNFTEKGTYFALLLKNSVIRQICNSVPKMHLHIKNMSQYCIDAKKEFGASVDASLFIYESGNGEAACNVYDFYTKQMLYQYGWVNGKFVSDTHSYKNTEYLDGSSPINWRSGIKHDCQSVLELEKSGDTYVNKLGEEVIIEDEYIYPYVKSSDIQKDNFEKNHVRYVIVPQKKIGENTELLQYSAPLTYNYLLQHKNFFDQRKSSIYKKQYPFSIFGIGNYTFMPYKIVVSSLYKEPRFVLLSPINGKCVIPDDTCYLVGFDKYENAHLVYDLLTDTPVRDFIQSVSFQDAKRIITKELLMRINLRKVSSQHINTLEYFLYSPQQELLFD
ncbi:MAG: SAM-dependent methyltransferase [Bacteroidales bacterium]|nr:SAM-dependent methyltransferase [Bacteroidales bacterium]